jgi:hypothetical protein
MERKTRFELATPSLARRCSTTEPLPLEPCGPLMFNTCCFEQSRLKVPWYTRPPKPFEPGVLLVLPLHSSIISRPPECPDAAPRARYEPRLSSRSERASDVRDGCRCIAPKSASGTPRGNGRSAHRDSPFDRRWRPGYADAHGHALHAEILSDRPVPLRSSRVFRSHAVGRTMQLFPAGHFSGQTIASSRTVPCQRRDQGREEHNYRVHDLSDPRTDSQRPGLCPRRDSNILCLGGRPKPCCDRIPALLRMGTYRRRPRSIGLDGEALGSLSTTHGELDSGSNWPERSCMRASVDWPPPGRRSRACGCVCRQSSRANEFHPGRIRVRPVGVDLGMMLFTVAPPRYRARLDGVGRVPLSSPGSIA